MSNDHQEIYTIRYKELSELLTNWIEVDVRYMKCSSFK